MKRGEVWMATTVLDAEPARFTISPSATNRLELMSQAMVDKISTVPKRKVAQRIGRLDPSDIVLLNRHLAIFLGLAD